MVRSNEVAQAVAQILAGDDESFATFAVVGADDRWVQYKIGQINAAYPFADDPVRRLAPLADFAVLGWEANRYVFGDLVRGEPRAIAAWIDVYFREILQCAPGYDLTIEVEL